MEYLTESKLGAILASFVDVESQVKISDTRLRSDYTFKYNDKLYVVEFDGDSHYCNPEVIERDRRKDKYWESVGYTVVRVPYWLQLHSGVFAYLFGFLCPSPLPDEFPHGFISPAAKPPAFYCVDGVGRFISEVGAMRDFLPDVVYQIFDSISKYKKLSPDRVIPKIFDFTNKKAAENIIPSSLIDRFY